MLLLFNLDAYLGTKVISQEDVKMTEAKKAPTNDAAAVAASPLLGLLIAGDANGDGIYAEEAQGQQSFVGSDTLPTEIHGDGAKEALESAGVIFHDVVEGDSLFQYVTIPEGWEKKATDHSMHSDLVDGNGRVRAYIFYKAAFYDRNAHMSLTCRYGVNLDYDRLDSEKVAVVNVMDGDQVIHTTDPIALPEDNSEHYATKEQAQKLAISWLDKNYNEWRNPTCYWE